MESTGDCTISGRTAFYSLFYDDFEAMENGYRCAINDIKEKYINED